MAEPGYSLHYQISSFGKLLLAFGSEPARLVPPVWAWVRFALVLAANLGHPDLAPGALIEVPFVVFGGGRWLAPTWLALLELAQV